jgi:SAM-dependent methyltransferase
MEARRQYDAAFYLEQKDGSYGSARVIVPLVQELLPIRSVCDVGCGVGTWLRAFRECGVDDVIGIDGDYVDRALLQIPTAAFTARDLRTAVTLDRRFDLAISLEVAEHLPESRAASFVDDLVRLAPVVVFSAAIPRQGGTGHVNEQWQTYWAALFARHGFVACDPIRPLVWDDERVDVWYRQNTLVYCAREILASSPRLAASRSALPLALVHPESFREKRPGVKGAVRLLERELRSAVSRRLGMPASVARAAR